MARDRAARPEARPLRLFVAIEVPDDVKRSVARTIEPWRDRLSEVRWAPRENWHVTLMFLGRTFPRLVGWVGEQVVEEAGGCTPFETHLTELGAFPSVTRARVLWAGLDDREGRMAGLALAISTVLSREFAPEARPFRPHLTVARSGPPLELPPGFAGTQLEPVAFRVDHVTLFRSHLQRPAARYEPLGVFPLGGPAAAR